MNDYLHLQDLLNRESDNAANKWGVVAILFLISIAYGVMFAWGYLAQLEETL